LRAGRTITKRTHGPSVGRNRFSAAEADEESAADEGMPGDDELMAAASTAFVIPAGFSFDKPTQSVSLLIIHASEQILG